MTAGTPLDRLAEAHRIEPGYTDMWGRRHAISEDSKRALLGTMGVAADSDAAIQAGLEAVRAAAFQPLVPAALVVTEGEPIALPVTTDASAAGRIVWTFDAETGEEKTGVQALADLDVSERSEGRTRRLLTLPLPAAARLSPPDVHSRRWRNRRDRDHRHPETRLVAGTPRRPRHGRPDRPALRPALRPQCRHRRFFGSGRTRRDHRADGRGFHRHQPGPRALSRRARPHQPLRSLPAGSF